MKIHFLLYFFIIFFTLEFNAQNVPKVHLFEQFTSTSCPTCGYRNPEFYDEVLEPYEEQIIHIAYHNHLPLTIDPFFQANISENRGRSDFYGVKASPSLVLNGKLLTPARPLFKGSEVEAILDKTSPLQLEVLHYKADGNFNAQVDAKLLQNLPEADYNLYIAVVEKEILFCTYFEYVFDNVFRAFVEEGNGVPFNLREAEAAGSYLKKIPLNDEWEYSMLYAVAFVQNTLTKEIINAGASIIVDRGEASRFSNDAFKLTGRVYHSQCGEPFGSIELGVCVDASPIEFPEDVNYLWSNGDTTQNLTNVPTGTYNIEIKDNKHNTVIEQTFEILPSEAIEVEEIITPANPANQFGGANIIVNGSYGGFTIMWNDGNTDFNRNDLSKGEYYYLITDARGCQQENGITIERSFSSNDIEVTTKDVSCNGEENGSVNINLLNADAGDVVLVFKYDALVQNTDQLSTGIYRYQVIDSFNDVLLEDTFVIAEPEILTTEIIITDENQLIAQVTGGIPPYDYLWSDGTLTEAIETPITNNYSVIVTDANVCTVSADLIFTDIKLPESQSPPVATIFPNPVKSGGSISVNSTQPINDIQFYKVDGSLASNVILSNKKSTIFISFDSGIYIAKVVLLNEKAAYIKLLVE